MGTGLWQDGADQQVFTVCSSPHISMLSVHPWLLLRQYQQPLPVHTRHCFVFATHYSTADLASLCTVGLMKMSCLTTITALFFTQCTRSRQTETGLPACSPSNITGSDIQAVRTSIVNPDPTRVGIGCGVGRHP